MVDKKIMYFCDLCRIDKYKTGEALNKPSPALYRHTTNPNSFFCQTTIHFCHVVYPVKKQKISLHMVTNQPLFLHHK